MIKREDIEKWVQDRSRTIESTIDCFFHSDLDRVITDMIHDCITELSQDKWVAFDMIEGKALNILIPKDDSLRPEKIYEDRIDHYGDIRSHWLELPNDK
jgi:hypothetical protein